MSPPQEQGCKVHCSTSDHGHVSGGGASPLGKGFPRVDSNKGLWNQWGTGGGLKGGTGGRGRIGFRDRGGSLRRGGLYVATNNI